MKELAIHCTIYVSDANDYLPPEEWDNENAEESADHILYGIRMFSADNGGWDFDYQIYDAEVHDV